MIKRDIMISDYETFAKALNSSWIKKYLDTHNCCKMEIIF